jgi:hypothetical protein
MGSSPLFAMSSRLPFFSPLHSKIDALKSAFGAELDNSFDGC